MRAKLRPIIKCLNGPLNHYEEFAPAFHSRERIVAKDANGYREAGTSPTFEVSTQDKGEETTECAAELEKGASLPPSVTDLDALAKETASALRAMIGPGTQFDAYLKQSKYLDDHYARGRELDAEVSPLLTKTLALTRDLRKAVSRQNGVIRQHELDAIERSEGRNLHWHTQQTLIAARATNEQISEANHQGKLDAASVQAAIQPFQAAMESTQDYLAQHPQQDQAASGRDKPVWFQVDNMLALELKDAKELREMLASPDQDAAENPTLQHDRVLSQVGTTNDAFNAVIRSYNFAIGAAQN